MGFWDVTLISFIVSVLVLLFVNVVAAWQEWKNPSPSILETPAVRDAIAAAVRRERERATNIAWKMQMEQFGGGTAIGNAIQDPTTDSSR